MTVRLRVQYGQPDPDWLAWPRACPRGGQSQGTAQAEREPEPAEARSDP